MFFVVLFCYLAVPDGFFQHFPLTSSVDKPEFWELNPGKLGWETTIGCKLLCFANGAKGAAVCSFVKGCKVQPFRSCRIIKLFWLDLADSWTALFPNCFFLFYRGPLLLAAGWSSSIQNIKLSKWFREHRGWCSLVWSRISKTYAAGEASGDAEGQLKSEQWTNSSEPTGLSF